MANSIFLFYLLPQILCHSLLSDFTEKISESFEEKTNALYEFTAHINKLWSISSRNVPLQEKRPFQNSTKNFHRILQSSSLCSKGKSLNAFRQLYFCNSKSVTKEIYDSLSTNSSNSCTTNQTLSNVCYCPMDYSGNYCQANNRIKCVIQDYYTEGCPKFDSFYYNDRWDGDSPCKSITPYDILTFRVGVSCSNADQSNLKEGIKTDGEFSGYNSPNFTYAYNTTTLVKSNQFTITPIVTMIDWNYISKKVILNLNPLQITEFVGISDYNVNIDMSKIESRFSNFGRYYFELDFMVEEGKGNETEKYSAIDKIITHHIEDLSYIEPQRKKSLSAGAIALIILFSIILIGAFSFGVYYHRKKKREANEEQERRLLNQND